MNIARIIFSGTYVQDEHQRTAQALQTVVDTHSTQIDNINKLPSYTTGTYRTEVNLAYVYMQSVTAGAMQQCVETITYANGTGSTARAYMATMPFSGSIVGLAVDINPSIASVQTVSLYKNGAPFVSFTVAANASKGSVPFVKGKYPFSANDYLFGAVVYATTVNQGTCSFVKAYVEMGAS